MPVPFLNQTNGQLEFYNEQDLTPDALPLLTARGLRQATPEDVANRERTLEYSSVGQQALAQAERVVRGATLGQVEGVGSDEDIRARAEVSEEVSPVLSLAADFAPDVGLGILTGGGSALLTTAGRTAAKGLGRAALSAAAKAAPRAALAGEAAAGGLVTASQQAFSEGRQFFHENPVEDATNTLLWSGIGGVLAGAPQAFRALKATGKASKAAAEVVDEAELAAARAAGEANAVPMPASAGPSTTGVPLTSDEGTQSAYEASHGLEARPIVNKPDVALDDVRLPDAEGYLEKVGPEEAARFADDIRSVSDTAIVGKSLEDLKALPIEGDESRAKIDAFKGDKSFRESGMLPSNNDRGRGGLPAFGVDADGSVYLNNGRHRLTAAKENGQEFIVANVKRYDAEGNTVWDYVGPVRVNQPSPQTDGALAMAMPEPKVAKPRAVLAAEKGVDKAERNAVRSQADDIVRKAVKGEEPLGRVDGFLRDSRLAQYQPEIIDVATKEMRNDLNELNRLSQGIRDRAVKQEDVAKNIADNLPAQQAKARDIALAGQRLAGEMRIEAQQLGQQLGKKGPAYFSGTARDLVSSIIERTEAISHMSNGAEIFNALDDLKRVVDNHKVALESGARKSTKDPIRYQELVPKVEAFAHQIRASLEDVPTFGRAGEMQKAYNATYHQKWFPAKQVFEESVFKRTGRDYKAFDTLDAWESKVTGLLENAGTGERRHVTDMLGALRDMAEQRAKFGTASKGETDRIASLVDKIERTFKLADDTNAAKGRLETLMPVAQAAGSAVGAGVGGLAGAILGGSVAKGAAELATGKYRRAFMAMRGATEETVERSVDDWIQVSKGRAAASGTKRSRFPKVELTPENRHLLKTAKRMGVTFGFAEFLGDNNDPQSAFSTKRDALLDDEGFVNRFADEFGDLAQEEPQVYAVAAGKAGEIRKFLLDRLPSSVAVSMARPNGYPPTNEAIEDWSVYWNAATNPRSVVQSMSRGDIRPQEVETLRTLYRPLYEKLQATLIDRISNATNMGDDLDDQFVMRMSLLFDLDGAGTPAFSQRAANVARQVAPSQPPQQGKPFAPKAGARVSPSNVAITGPTYGTIG